MNWNQTEEIKRIRDKSEWNNGFVENGIETTIIVEAIFFKWQENGIDGTYITKWTEIEKKNCNQIIVELIENREMITCKRDLFLYLLDFNVVKTHENWLEEKQKKNEKPSGILFVPVDSKPELRPPEQLWKQPMSH